jgi:hypothetical protein
VEVQLTELELTALASQVAEIVLERLPAPSPWMDAAGAAEYCAMTVDSIRSATKRELLTCHRSTTGRVRYRREDVDAFLRGEG